MLDRAHPRLKYSGSDYVEASNPSHEFTTKSSIKAIAFYLPQYHPIPENDAWWGKGFTEWTNVSKAVPQFVGHYQPRLPGELGFYDLRIREVMHQQVKLARDYGLYGFCFYHYWFAGKRLLEKPVDQFVADTELDFPFCLCWANENWTRRWDGKEHEVLAAQRHSPEDDLDFIRQIEPYLLDPRYIRINGRPLLIVYRPTLLPDPIATTKRWRDYWSGNGHGELYLVSALTFDCSGAAAVGFDAVVEFPPHQVVLEPKTANYRYVNPDYVGSVYDYRDLSDAYRARRYDGETVFRSVAVGWDNTARRPNASVIYAGNSPKAYGEWLRSACQVANNEPGDKRMVFINAWNEWAEGAYLEPDRKYGYAFLAETAKILSEFTEH